MDSALHLFPDFQYMHSFTSHNTPWATDIPPLLVLSIYYPKYNDSNMFTQKNRLFTKRIFLLRVFNILFFS